MLLYCSNHSCPTVTNRQSGLGKLEYLFFPWNCLKEGAPLPIQVWQNLVGRGRQLLTASRLRAESLYLIFCSETEVQVPARGRGHASPNSSTNRKCLLQRGPRGSSPRRNSRSPRLQCGSRLRAAWIKHLSLCTPPSAQLLSQKGPAWCSQGPYTRTFQQQKLHIQRHLLLFPTFSSVAIWKLHGWQRQTTALSRVGDRNHLGDGQRLGK